MSRLLQQQLSDDESLTRKSCWLFYIKVHQIRGKCKETLCKHRNEYGKFRCPEGAPLIRQQRGGEKRFLQVRLPYMNGMMAQPQNTPFYTPQGVPLPGTDTINKAALLRKPDATPSASPYINGLTAQLQNTPQPVPLPARETIVGGMMEQQNTKIQGPPPSNKIMPIPPPPSVGPPKPFGKLKLRCMQGIDLKAGQGVFGKGGPLRQTKDRQSRKGH